MIHLRKNEENNMQIKLPEIGNPNREVTSFLQNLGTGKISGISY